MNPSKELWITKFFKLSNPSFFINQTEEELYENIRKTGFIYGFTTKSIQPVFNSFDLTHEEYAKIVLLEALYGTFVQTKNETDFTEFTKHAEDFYRKMGEAKTESYFSFIKFESKKAYASLEKILNERTTRSSNYLDRTFSHHLSNFLIFTDVLCFKRYLLNETEILNYYKYLEQTLSHLVMISFNQKQNVSKYDVKLQEVLSSSLKYASLKNFDTQLSTLDLWNIKTFYGKAYIYDIALMVLWNDEKIDQKEFKFILQLRNLLGLQKDFTKRSLSDMVSFIEHNRSEIPYFQFTHPLKKLYKNTNKTVALLIKRNKKSLIKELENNKLLMQLIVKGTYSNLTAKEKLQLKNQFIELGKTVPAFTIFLIPGGSLLLPILIKLLPELIPNSFNENK
ncbi:MAG: LETM1-related biofilm-associated protein [Myroides sp.]